MRAHRRDVVSSSGRRRTRTRVFLSSVLGATALAATASVLVDAGTAYAATAPTSVTFTPGSLATGASSTWTIGFTSSGTGGLLAPDTITVTFPSGFTLPSSGASITLPSGFSNCSGAETTSSQVATITLSNSGGTCALAASASASLTIAGITNGAVNTYPASGFSVATTSDTTPANPSSAIVISTTTTSVSFSPSSPLTATSTTWTIGFTTSSSGALVPGNTVTVTFPSGFSMPSSGTSITLPSGFSNCSGAETTSSQVATITLSNSGGTCALATSTAATLTIAGITNAGVGSYTNTGFTVYTTADAAPASPSSNVVITTTQIVTWPVPAAITYGTALGSAQLNATAAIAGSFAYSPGSGTVLGAGTKTLTVTFTPTDTTDFSTQTATVSLTVNPAPLKITASSTSMAYGASPPAVTPLYVGFVNGESAASLTAGASCVTHATKATLPGHGTGDNTCSGAVDGNYAFTYVAGNVSVTAPVITLRTSALTIMSGSKTTVRLSCARALCHGTASIVNRQSTRVKRGKKTVTVVHTTTYAKRAFSIKSGKSLTLTLNLNSTGLARYGGASAAHPTTTEIYVTVTGGRTKARIVSVT